MNIEDDRLMIQLKLADVILKNFKFIGNQDNIKAYHIFNKIHLFGDNNLNIFLVVSTKSGK